MPCNSRDSEKHHWWLKEGVMTILSFCALFPLLQVFPLQLSQHSHTFLLSFSMCSSFFHAVGAYLYFQARICHTPLYLCWESGLHWGKLTSQVFFCLSLSGTHTQRCLGFSILLQLKGSLSNYFCSVYEDIQSFWFGQFQFSINFLYIRCFTGIKVLLRRNNHQYYLF